MTNITNITGGSEGFGRELAEHFAQDKHNLLLVARRFDLLENAKRELEGKYDVKIFIFSTDLTTPEGRAALKEYCDENRFHIDILVNNAGMGTGGAFHEIPSEKETSMIRSSQ